MGPLAFRYFFFPFIDAPLRMAASLLLLLLLLHVTKKEREQAGQQVLFIFLQSARREKTRVAFGFVSLHCGSTF